jgi:deoxyribonuclease-4
MAEVALFGTAGSPEAFYAAGGKSSAEMPGWLKAQGLDAFEYPSGRGVRIGEEAATALGREAAKHAIKMSLHAPYFINLATTEKERQGQNLRYFQDSLLAARAMGADRVVFHPGGQGKATREAAFARAKEGLLAILDALAGEGLGDILLFPETMGKHGQLGTLAEVVELCQSAPDRLRPVVDFGHLHARGGGGYEGKASYCRDFDYIGEKLGRAALQELHVHFSVIEFTKAGEKRHWTFADSYGPPFQPFIQAVAALGLTPRVICESAGTQDIDALAMKKYYESIKLCEGGC